MQKIPVNAFLLKGQDNCKPQEMELNMKMHKAISVIQFKVEGQAKRALSGIWFPEKKLSG